MSLEYLKLISGIHFEDVQLRLISRKVSIPARLGQSSSNVNFRLPSDIGSATKVDRRRKYYLSGTCSDLFWFAIDFESNEVETDENAFAVIPGTFSAHVDLQVVDRLLPFIERRASVLITDFLASPINHSLFLLYWCI